MKVSVKSFCVSGTVIFMLSAAAARGDEDSPASNLARTTVLDDSEDTKEENGAASEEVEHPHRISLAMTVSGGVSLGAYQAGYLYYLTQTAKLNPSLFDFRLITGASAGMINAMLTVIAMGQKDDAAFDPTESLFYKVWNEMRYDELLDVQKAPSGALSSRRVLNRLADLIETEWNKGLDENLDMVLGASATRLEGRDVKISESLFVQALEEKFSFRVRGRGKNKAPWVTNYVDRHFGLKKPLLPFSPPETPPAEGRSDFSIIRQIMFASSAIPLVFKPQEIDYCLTKPSSEENKEAFEDTPCFVPSRKDFFIDGGIVDKQPLRFAHRIARSGLMEIEPGRTVWRDEPDLEKGILPDNVFFLYVDPRTPSFPPPPSDDEDEIFAETAKMFKPAGQFLKGLFRSVQSKELYTLIEEHPEIRKRIQLAAHNFPTMSGQMANFFGFFDREIRKFDFFLGMLDARQFVKTSITKRMRQLFEDSSIDVVLPEDRFIFPAKKNIDSGWRPYFCLRAAVDGEKRFDAACQSDKLKDFKILAQATLDRLYDTCRRAKGESGMSNPHCRAAAEGKSPPLVRGVKKVPKNAWKRADDGSENQIEHTLRLLDLYGFRFRDLGLDRGDADLAVSRIREELLTYVDVFAKKLRYAEAVAVRILGKPAINFFAYSPPAGIVYLIAGTGAELALSATMGKFKWLRFNFALEFDGLNLFLTNKPNAFALTAAVGMEFEIFPAGSPLLQIRLGERIGYQFSTEDKFLTGACDSDWLKNDPIRCSAPTAQFFLAFTFYERIRLQIGLEWYPKWLPPMNEFDEHLFSGMLKFGWQWISPF